MWHSSLEAFQRLKTAFVLLISLADGIVDLERVEGLARGDLKGWTGSESLSNNHVFNDETTLLSCLFCKPVPPTMDAFRMC
jgi:hypothetical protein